MVYIVYGPRKIVYNIYGTRKMVCNAYGNVGKQESTRPHSVSRPHTVLAATPPSGIVSHLLILTTMAVSTALWLVEYAKINCR
jgi:hypothetical protein